MTRREWLKAVAAGLLSPALPLDAASHRAVRTFHLCLSPPIVVQDADLLRLIRDAGVGTVWLAGFFYGHQPYSDELLSRAQKRLEEAGIEAQLVNVPLV